MISAPSTSHEAVVQGFSTGLTGTVGFQVIDNIGGVTIARTTAGIAERPTGSGVYIITFTTPSVDGEYTIIWDRGSISPSTIATEELTITTPVASAVVVPFSSKQVGTSALQSYWGKDKTFLVTVTDQGTPVDLTGKTLTFTAKGSVLDPNPALVTKTTGAGIVHSTQAGATLGQAKITISAADTQSKAALPPNRDSILAWALDLLDTGASFTVDAGTWEILPSVTEAPGEVRSALARLRERVRLFIDGDADPKVSEREIDILLQMGRRVDLFGNPPDVYNEWAPGVGVAVGDKKTPTGQVGDQYIQIIRNGYYYTCTVAGVSGLTEPVWPVVVGATIADGAVTWSCTGTAPWNPVYDINYAIAQGWLLKSGRLAGHYNFMSAGRMFSREQFYNHCMTQYRLFSSKAGIKSLRLGKHSPLSDTILGAVTTSTDG